MFQRMICLLAFCASLLPAAVPARASTAPAGEQHRGTLYRVRYHGNTTYLFGTIHVGLPSFFPLEPQVMKAFTQARRLVVELDPRDAGQFQAALKRHGMYADGDSLDKHLPPAALARVRQSLQRVGVPYERASHMKPWLIANLLVAMNLQGHGYQRDDGTEFHLLAMADQRKMPIVQLESADFQMGLFDDMSDADQQRYLLENMAEIDDGEALKQDVALIDAWAHANDAAIEGVLRDASKGKPLATDFTQHVLLDRRNPAMADKIAALMREDGGSFVAVGLLHLVGKGGVPALLRQRGYEVEKLY